MSHKSRLLTATARILRPIVRMLLRHGIPYQSLSELARWTYVDVARREFEIPGQRQTRSRVSVVTGLSRKEVQRLVDAPAPTDESAVESHHRAARIVSAWVRNPIYLDAGGEPRRLLFDGPEPSFTSLALSLGGDVSPKSVLDELLRVGSVANDSSGKIQLGARAYLPTGSNSDEERYAILGFDVAALLDTIDHNLNVPPEERFFQRKVAYRRVPVDSVPAIRVPSGGSRAALARKS